MQNPTPVMTSGNSRNELLVTNLAHASICGFGPASANASMTLCGNVQIDP